METMQGFHKKLGLSLTQKAHLQHDRKDKPKKCNVLWLEYSSVVDF